VADCKFEKKFRLLSASDFSALKVDSLSYKKPTAIIYYKKNSLNLTRIGLSVPKKIGKASVRNRLKRLIREYFRQSSSKYLGYDILFVVSWSRAVVSFSEIEKENNLLAHISEFLAYLDKRK
jgi:ribonuclease P protein component